MVEGPAATPAPTVQATAPAPVEAAAPVVGVEEREMGGAVLPGAVTGAEIEAEETNYRLLICLSTLVCVQYFGCWVG